MIEDMSVIQGGNETQFVNETDDFGLFDDPTSTGQPDQYQRAASSK